MEHEAGTCGHCQGKTYRVRGSVNVYHTGTRSIFCTPANPTQARTDWRKAGVADA